MMNKPPERLGFTLIDGVVVFLIAVTVGLAMASVIV